MNLPHRNGDTVAGLIRAPIEDGGLIELTELAAHVRTVVPKVAAGIVVRAITSEPDSHKQAARFGSRGEDFAVVRWLP